MSTTVLATTPTMVAPAEAELRTSDISEEAVYTRMIAMQEQYPTGMRWTNANTYKYGAGCVAFAVLIQDAAFDVLPIRTHYDFNNIRAGDTIRMDNNKHTVIVLNVADGKIIVAEGNISSKVKWGREITLKEVKSTGTYVRTRYPEDFDPSRPIVAITPSKDIAYVEPTGAQTPTPAPSPAPVTTKAPSTKEKKDKVQTVTTGEASDIVIINSSTADKRIYNVTNGSANSSSTTNYGAESSQTINGVNVKTTKDSSNLTVTHNGQTYTVRAGETLTLNP